MMAWCSAAPSTAGGRYITTLLCRAARRCSSTLGTGYRWGPVRAVPPAMTGLQAGLCRGLQGPASLPGASDASLLRHPHHCHPQRDLKQAVDARTSGGVDVVVRSHAMQRWVGGRAAGPGRRGAQRARGQWGGLQCAAAPAPRSPRRPAQVCGLVWRQPAGPLRRLQRPGCVRGWPAGWSL